MIFLDLSNPYLVNFFQIFGIPLVIILDIILVVLLIRQIRLWRKKKIHSGKTARTEKNIQDKKENSSFHKDLLLASKWIQYKCGNREILEDIVREKSRSYQTILDINRKYDFHMIPPVHVLTRTCTNKTMYDAPVYNYVLRCVGEKLSEYQQLVQYAKENEENDRLYGEDLSSVPNYLSESELRELSIPRDLGKDIEKRICENAMLYPVTRFIIRCEVRYTSPGGRNSYYRDVCYNFEEIQQIIEAAKGEKHRKESAEYQRSKMNQSLRYEVMKRDGFRCVLCGRSAIEDHVRLHVDHIRPVSKGGKTEMSNLRTLCQDCNLGKSDKFDPDGTN